VADSASSTGLGTPSYMAPEQVTNPDTAGPPADLYSLSVIFYELLVDVLPRGHWQPPSGGRADVPAGIDTLIEAGLSNRPANRPQSTADYRKRLVDAVNLTPVKTSAQTVNTVVHQSAAAAKPNLIGRYALYGGLGLAGLIAVSAIASTGAREPVDPKPFGPVNPDPLPPEPTPQPTVSGYANLAGSWDTAAGTIYSVQITDDGRFSGVGYEPSGTQVELTGQFNGVNADYTVYAPALNSYLSGQMVWDGACHISFQTFDASNSYVALNGQMHVNHTPGGPCP
jgi:serine/threonine protein kinase